MINDEDIKKVCFLAKLTFDSKELLILKNQLKSMMKMFEELDNVKCKDIDPLHSESNLCIYQRPDNSVSYNIESELFSYLNYDDDFRKDLNKKFMSYIVPKVIE